MEGIEYEPIARPARGETTRINEGITWLRMPLPFALNHINLWLLRDDDGWVIVDTGVDTKTSRGVWEATFAGAMNGDPATHVIATHLHPDHVGCAGWLVDHYGVDLWMTRSEYLLCRILIGDTGHEAPSEGVKFYKAAGFTDEQLSLYRATFGAFGKLVGAMPLSYRRMQDGEHLHFAGYDWQIIVGSGHSPEHACLYDADRNILISGDQILPTISPNVSVWPTEPQADPLRDWFDSINKLEAVLPEDVLILPAHGKPFRGAHARLEQLRKDHTDRLDILLNNAAEPRRVVDTFDDLFSSMIDDTNRIMATGESLAHLRYLVSAGEMTAETDTEGVSWYRRN